MGTPISSTNKTDRHDITEILLKVALNAIKQTNNVLIFHIVLLLKMYYHDSSRRIYILWQQVCDKMVN